MRLIDTAGKLNIVGWAESDQACAFQCGDFSQSSFSRFNHQGQKDVKGPTHMPSELRMKSVNRKSLDHLFPELEQCDSMRTSRLRRHDRCRSLQQTTGQNLSITKD
ncbi:hypothetical protein [Rhizobium lentis]|uniref:hypothetical protein n=1 Tax=Rhizobium lentis TaxID=1138194 RepID=UPI001C83E7FB|nr:hypothetical protein [Rhizobium lentis]